MRTNHQALLNVCSFRGACQKNTKPFQRSINFVVSMMHRGNNTFLFNDQYKMLTNKWQQPVYHLDRSRK